MNNIAMPTTQSWLLMQYYVILLIVICIIVIGLIIYVRRNNKIITELLRQQNHEELNTFKHSIESMNKGLVDDIIDVLKDDNIAHQDKHETIKGHQEELLNTFTKLKHIIKDDLYSTMHATGACRTALYLFHNGTKSTEGISFVKISCIGERTLIGSGVKEQILNHTNMPVNMFDNMYEKLIENGKYIIMNNTETMQTSRQQFISAAKIRYSQAIAIYDSSNNILGFVLAEFDHAYNKTISDTETTILKEFSKKISPILSFSEYADLTLKARINNSNE